MDQPLVSIIIPTYNQSQYVEKTVMSCLEQTYSNIEILISDDASADGTATIALDLARRFPDKVKAEINQQNLGVSANCNQLLRRCQGRYVALFAGDDLMYASKIARQVDQLESDSNLALSSHDMHIVSGDADDDTPTGSWSDFNRTGGGGYEALMEHLCFVCGCSLLVRRDCIPSSGYVESIVASDWLLFNEVLLHADQQIGYVDEVLGAYRRRPGQLTAKSSPDSISLFMDHAFACGYLSAKYSESARVVATGLRNWKSATQNTIRDNSMWGDDVTDSKLNSPRWLFRRLLKSIWNRIGRNS